MQGLDDVPAGLNDPLGDFVNHLSSGLHIRRRATGSRLNHFRKTSQSAVPAA
jgi:hypothetical protein